MLLGAAFWIGFALSMLKLLEILLSQERQRLVQDWIETITIRLDDLDLSALYRALKKTRIQLGLAVLTLIIINALIAVDNIENGIPLKDWVRDCSTTCVVFEIISNVLLLTLFPLALRWLIRAEGVASFSMRVGLLFGVAMLLLYVVTRDSLYLSLKNVWSLVMPIFVLPLTIALYASIYVIAIKSAQFFVWFFTKVLWRVVEYPKGAWAAVLFVTTAVLGFVQILIQAKR